MNAEQLLTHYERMAEAPDAIARLRRFVLDLAVRGKLAGQDCNDMPAAQLIEQIREERSHRVSRGELRKSKGLALNSDGPVFDAPSSWCWCLADDVWDFENGDRSSNYPSRDQLVSEGVPFINAGHLQEGQVSLDDMNYITRSKFESLGGGKLRRGDQLYCLRGSLGKHAHFDHDTDAAIASSLVILRPVLADCMPYLRVYLDSDIAETFLRRFDNGSAQPNLSSANLRRYEIPLPPLAEQHRIVAKVDELMALCNHVEEARKEREAARNRLTAASLARLNAPDPDPAIFTTHARFALDNLPALTTRADQIKQLRQTILNLAVRGKLVEQEAADEAASIVLQELDRSRSHKRKVAKVVEDELEFPLPQIPQNWAWTTVDAIANDVENAITDGPFGSQLKTAHYVAESDCRVIRLQNIGHGFFREEHRSFIEQSHFDRLSKHHVHAGDLVVAGLVDPSVRCCIVPQTVGQALVKADCYRFSVHTMFPARYPLYYLNSPLAQEFAAAHHHGMTLTRIGLGNFRKIPVPFPPISEQHRIVAKLDELMALCDRLEASLAIGDKTRQRLLEAILHESLEPAEARELEAA